VNGFISAADLQSTLAPFIVGAVALVVVLLEFLKPGLRRAIGTFVALAGVIAAGVAAAQTYGPATATFGGAFLTGGFTVIFEEIILVATAFSLLLLAHMETEERFPGSCALMMWSATGAMLMAGAGNLLVIFLGLELLSLALYCLCGLAPRASSRESALKYLILSSMASGFMLYGMALLFGATGSVALADIAKPQAVSTLYALGAGLFLVGVAFKLSLVPFHEWVPDVFEGAPLATTAFMSVVTKAGVIAVLARFAYAALPAASAPAMLAPLWVVAGLSMVIGNMAALAQTDIKRLLAYSGIAQVGYIVAAFAGATPLGMRYAIFYLMAYTFMNLGAFAVVALLSGNNEEGSRLASFAGLGQRRPLLAAAMTLFLLSLAGLPPTAGFIGKILILTTMTSAHFVWLAALLLAGTAISLYAYFKIIRVMYAPSRVSVMAAAYTVRGGVLPWITVGICLAGVLIMGFYPKTPSDVLPTVAAASVIK